MGRNTTNLDMNLGGFQRWRAVAGIVLKIVVVVVDLRPPVDWEC